MWDRLRKQAALEQEELHRLLEIHRPLLDRCEVTPPDAIELSALAAMLHAFYTGIENILKRIAIEVDGRAPSGEVWHRELLQAMTKPNESRREAISQALRERLQEYLEFRHVFRHAYTFELRWEKMRRLVLDCQETLVRFEAELQAFLRTGPSASL